MTFVIAPVSADAERRVAQIVGQFDAANEDSRFPDLGHPYYHAVDVRLHAYSDVSRWALIVEAVGYNPRGGNLFDVLHVFSNCLTCGSPGFEDQDVLPRVDNFADVQGQAERYRGAVPVLVRGHRLEIVAPTGTPLRDVFRLLVPAHRELLLAEESELRGRIPADLPEILRLDEWHQPDAFGPRPSGTQTYRLLAEVLATADPARYRPTRPSNTHWSNWPQSGSL
jgi:hypothetical protein